MSLRIDTAEWVGGSLVIGGTGLGVPGSAIPGSGDDGPAIAYNDLSLPADATKEIRILVTSWPAAGSMFVNEDTSFVFSAAPDGLYTAQYQLYVDGVLTGAAQTITLTVGAVPGVAMGTPAAASITAVAASATSGGNAAAGVAAGAPASILIALAAASAVGTNQFTAGAGSGAPVSIFLSVPAATAAGTNNAVPATDEPVTLAQAKAHLRIDADVTDNDALIASLLLAARQQAEHRTGRQFGLRVRQKSLDGFRTPIRLPEPPLRSVVSIEFETPDGIQQTLDPSAYRVRASVEPGLISPVTAWPATYDGPGAVRVTYICGLDATSPYWESLRAWMLLAIGIWYHNREAGGPVQTYALPHGFWDGLLDPLVFYGVTTQ